MAVRRVTPKRIESAMAVAVCVVVIALLAWTELPIQPGPAIVRGPVAISAIASSDQRPIALELLSAFAVLRHEPPLGAPPVPHDLARAMARQRVYLLNVSRARFVRVANHGFWIFPGSRGVCLVARIPGASEECTGAYDAVAVVGGGVGGATPAPGKTLVYGVAPDGNRFVSIVLVSGKVVHAQVVHNVYLATVNSPIQALIVKNLAGTPVRSPLRAS